MISTHFKDADIPDEFTLRLVELYAHKARSFIEKVRSHETIKKQNLELEDKVNERTMELIISLEREKELNELKSRFVSMASHEFRTPLSAILSSVALINAYHDDEQKEKRNKHIARVKASVKNMVDILNDFLSLDKLEQGKVDIVSEKFNLNEFVEDVLEDVNGILKHGQQINFSYNGDKEIIQDKKILKNVLLNLLSNAIKYSEEEKGILLSIEVNEGSVSIKVKDEGIGIPKEEQKKLFDKFFRAKNAVYIQGTGLGLNIVKRYVELLDGNISFVSELNQGTTFTIIFPQNVTE
jgi:signal transduction histidine kinase